jgi:hypothetical protein
VDLSPFDQGFIAGLLVTTGSFSGDGRVPCLGVKLHADDPEPLLILSRLLGGTLYGPYQHGGRHYAYWRLQGPALAAALPLFDAILPPSRKRTQYLAWKDRYRLSSSRADA